RSASLGLSTTFAPTRYIAVKYCARAIIRRFQTRVSRKSDEAKSFSLVIAVSMVSSRITKVTRRRKIIDWRLSIIDFRIWMSARHGIEGKIFNLRSKIDNRKSQRLQFHGDPSQKVNAGLRIEVGHAVIAVPIRGVFRVEKVADEQTQLDAPGSRRLEFPRNPEVVHKIRVQRQGLILRVVQVLFAYIFRQQCDAHATMRMER